MTNIEELDISILQRTSSDMKRDSGNYGSQLLQICKNHMICIFNGRCGLGEQMTVDGLVIDYIIGSAYLLYSRAKKCDIIRDFDPLFSNSDKHCIISLELYGLNSNEESYEDRPKREDEDLRRSRPGGRWKEERRVDFQDNLDNDMIEYLFNNSTSLNVVFDPRN